MGCKSSKVKRTFRDGNYHKKVTIGKRRVKDGECAAIWDRNGGYRTVIGPKRETIYMSDVRFLTRYIAAQNEYLEIKYRNGRKEHVRGPQTIFLDPCLHESIVKHEAISLISNEAIVVYQEAWPVIAERSSNLAPISETDVERQLGVRTEPSMTDVSVLKGDRRVERRVVKGPTLFIPDANEWLHEFSWHGPVGDKAGDKGHHRSDLNKFKKLRTLPDHLYYNVTDVRTADDAQLKAVKLMIFFKLEDTEKMLDSTHDPIGDFINAVCADVISFAASNTFEIFLTKTGLLNEIDTFPVLQQRASAIGYSISKVVFRGYKASEQLQAMHDQAIKSRTSLRLQSDTAEQEQKMEDLILAKSIERSEKQRQMEAEQRAHVLELEARDHAEKLRQKTEEAKSAHAQRQAAQDQRLAFLAGLSTEGVELTKYLCAESANQSVGAGGTKVIRVENSFVGEDPNEQDNDTATSREAKQGGRDIKRNAPNAPHIHINAGRD
jgi:regulator of protease activity HflC (stomatin/prohibitin superfamily)